MNVEAALQGVTRLFLDTAPVIYYLENNPIYQSLVVSVFDRIEAGRLTAVTSPVTLAECLVHPYRLGRTKLQQAYQRTIVNAENTLFQTIGELAAQRAAQLRASYNLSLPDFLQLAAALAANCEAFLTNDINLKRVGELQILVIKELEEA
ncbi:PIN domain-containing protein [Synechococcus sp. PCC 7336]|uniref:type II toxin-antitoxin system VapC family toxin n=1 Tax=Synechococcus sp. PCC 7336 TaxID=195250 RepID=UPI000348A452|nr:PIN domain-containing protein [Synechococcus sp. PCC 7336]